VFEPTGRWEVRFVFDSNWDKAVPADVRPDGVLDHVYGGFSEAVRYAYTYLDDNNHETPESTLWVSGFPLTKNRPEPVTAPIRLGWTYIE
jgi:hypothetical protein